MTNPFGPRTLVVCAGLDWFTPLSLGSHHLARAFAARGWKVAFVSYPTTPLHAGLALRSAEHRRRLRAALRSPRREGNVAAFLPTTWAPLAGARASNTPSIVDNWHRATLPRLGQQLRAEGFGAPDILMVDNPIHHWVLDELRPDRLVHRVADHTPSFHGVGPVLLDREARIAQAADASICTSSELVPYVRSLGGPEPEIVPPAVDAAMFGSASPEPVDLREIPRPRAIYVGAIRSWFDTTLVLRLARERPQLHVVLVGPDMRLDRALRNEPNVHVLGARPHGHVPAYLQHADVGLIPFDVDGHPDLVHSVNPLKLLEYLAAGLPVVSRRWDALTGVAGPALLASDQDQFLAAVDEALANRTVLAARGRAFAAGQDWDARVQAVIEAAHAGGR